jgi:hypothetical protein
MKASPPTNRPRKARENVGLSRTGAYGSYHSMLKRCYNQKCSAYAYYGGRGVTVCDRWRLGFAAFLEDMGQRPEGLSLDRIDPYGNYEPSNCRWADKYVQAINKRGVKTGPRMKHRRFVTMPASRSRSGIVHSRSKHIGPYGKDRHFLSCQARRIKEGEVIHHRPSPVGPRLKDSRFLSRWARSVSNRELKAA